MPSACARKAALFQLLMTLLVSSSNVCINRQCTSYCVLCKERITHCIDDYLGYPVLINGIHHFRCNRKGLNVARQLAMSTVIAWFGSLSFDKQKDALDRMQVSMINLARRRERNL